MINDLLLSNIVLKQDLINDKKGLESLPEIIYCVLWHGPVMEFILDLHCIYINNKKFIRQLKFMEILQHILAQTALKFCISQYFPLCQNLEYFPGR